MGRPLNAPFLSDEIDYSQAYLSPLLKPMAATAATASPDRGQSAAGCCVS